MKNSTLKPIGRGVYIGPVDRSNEVTRFLNLLRALVLREFKGRYRRSLLGPTWAILQPLIYMFIFNFLRGAFRIDSEGVPYVIFSYCALVPWTFFSNAVTRAGPSVYSNGSIIKKMAISTEIFPLSGVVVSLVDFVIAFSILAGMMVWYRTPITWVLLWIPVLIALTSMLALGIGLGVASIGTFKRDIIIALPFIMQIAMLATPVVYPLSQIPDKYQGIVALNPMTGIIQGFRGVIVKGLAPDLNLLALSLIGIVVVWLVAWPLFRSTSRYFVDVL